MNKNGNLFIDYPYGSVGENMFKKTGQILGFIKNDIQQCCKYNNKKNEPIISLCTTSYWSDELLKDNNFINFYNELKKSNYDDNVKSNIIKEVPILVTDDMYLPYFSRKNIKIYHWMCNIRPMIIIYLQLQKKI